MRLDGANLGAIVRDFDAAMTEFADRVGRDPAYWGQRSLGKWSVGQHAEHLARCMEEVADALEKAERRLIAGTLPPPPWRGPLQALFVALVVARGGLPRGARTPARFEAGPEPAREAVLARLAEAARRHRALALRIAPEAADRLWAPNPFHPAWHYRLPEMLRMHAVHARHHGAIVRETLEGGD